MTIEWCRRAGSGHIGWHGFPAAHGGGRRHPSLRHIDVPSRESIQDLLEGDAAFQARQRRTQAVVGPYAEGQVRAGAAVDVESITVEREARRDCGGDRALPSRTRRRPAHGSGAGGTRTRDQRIMSPGRRLRVGVLCNRSRACGRILDYVGHSCIDLHARRPTLVLLVHARYFLARSVSQCVSVAHECCASCSPTVTEALSWINASEVRS